MHGSSILHVACFLFLNVFFPLRRRPAEHCYEVTTGWRKLNILRTTSKESVHTFNQWLVTIAGRLLRACGPRSAEQPGKPFPRMIAELHSAICLVSRRPS